HERDRGGAGDHLELGLDAREGVRRVLAVDEDDVETAAGHDLRGDRRAGDDPAADEGTVGGLDRVDERRRQTQTNRHVTAPRGPYSACTTSPGSTHIGRVKGPARTSSSASSVAPCCPSSPASQATPVAGWPSTAAATPDSSIVSLR